MTSRSLPNGIKLDGVAELIRCDNIKDGWANADIVVEYNPTNWCLPIEFEHLRLAWDVQHPNQRSDPKIALREIQFNSDHTLICRLQSTTWREVRPLHEMSNLATSTQIRKKLNGYEMLLPNIGVVHVIASTIDGWIFAFQRSAKSHYYPCDWSATYEEGLAPEDIGRSMIFQQAARRGLCEEISADLHSISLESFKVMSIVNERSHNNPAVIILAKLPISRSELPIQRPSDELDQGAYISIPIDLQYMSKALSTSHFHFKSTSDRWHPTARYRLLIAMAHYFGEDVAAMVLARIKSVII